MFLQNLRQLKKTKLGECMVDCDKDSDCEEGLECADAHKDYLKKMGYGRKAYCGDIGKRHEEVCYNPLIFDH